MSGPPVLSQTWQAGLLAQRGWLDQEQRLTAFLANLATYLLEKRRPRTTPRGTEKERGSVSPTRTSSS